MDDKKKKYEKPEAEVIDFNNEDIITMSVGATAAGWTDGEDFENE